MLNPMAPRAASRPGSVGEATRTRIIAAVLECLRTNGVVGTSARAIARTGDFNQALIFYHFGSVTELLIAAGLAESDRRAQRYSERLAGVTSLPELVAVARALHEEELAQGSVAVLTQMLAAAAHSDELRQALLDGFQPWMRLVEEAVERVLAGTPYAGVSPITDLSFTIASLFLGIELMSGLDPARAAERRLFTTIDTFAGLADTIMRR
jgi:AcrR family transcriptional regulator